ncbi:MAG: hypothetical protein ABR554_08160 [Pyrinomonadaceae bacterium]
MIMGNDVSKVFAAALLCAAAATARADVRVRWRNSASPAHEVTLYLKGSAQRRELTWRQPDGRVMTSAFVDDCARRRLLWLDPANRRYAVVHEGGVPAAVIAAFNEQQFAPTANPRLKGTLTETITVTDTGERREMFGFTARRLKTLTTWRVVPDGCDAGQARVETDGWYVDLLYGVDCSPDLSGAMPRMAVDLAGSKCLGKRLASRKYFFRRHYEGPARLGFPLSETTRTYDGRGGVRTQTHEVLELSTDRLDDSLFAVPAGYERFEPRDAGKPSLLSRTLSIFR